MTVAISIAALLISVLTALGAGAIARRVRVLELQSDNSIKFLRGGAPASLTGAGEAFLQGADQSLVLSACGSCGACAQVVDGQLDHVHLPAAVARIVVQPEDDPVADEHARRVRELGWTVQTVDRGSFLAVSAGAYPSMLLSEGRGGTLTYLGPVGDPALFDKAVQIALDRTASLPQTDHSR
jgi:hypothetical protein